MGVRFIGVLAVGDDLALAGCPRIRDLGVGSRRRASGTEWKVVFDVPPEAAIVWPAEPPADIIVAALMVGGLGIEG
jgi:hypothetical protein